MWGFTPAVPEAQAKPPVVDAWLDEGIAHCDKFCLIDLREGRQVGRGVEIRRDERRIRRDEGE